MNRFVVLLAAAPVPIATLTAAAQTLDLPRRKAGLWQVTTVSEGGMNVPPITGQVCLDAATDREIWVYMMKKSSDGCKLVAKRQGQTHVIDADCPSPLLPAKMKTEITGDFQSNYTIRTEATMQLGSIKDVTLTTQTASWKKRGLPGHGAKRCHRVRRQN
jgi:hypothetical protein